MLDNMLACFSYIHTLPGKFLILDHNLRTLGDMMEDMAMYDRERVKKFCVTSSREKILLCSEEFMEMKGNRRGRGLK